MTPTFSRRIQLKSTNLATTVVALVGVTMFDTLKNLTFRNCVLEVATHDGRPAVILDSVDGFAWRGDSGGKKSSFIPQTGPNRCALETRDVVGSIVDYSGVGSKPCFWDPSEEYN